MRVSVVYHSESGNTEKMAALVCDGCERVEGVEAKAMSIDRLDEDFLAESNAVILGCPTYEGTVSWQMKRFLDSTPVSLAGKLCGVFASQNWPGGGGADFTEMTLIAGALVHGMIIYSGGVKEGAPYLHFGAVSAKAPTDPLYRDRCIHLGEIIARKTIELFEK